MTDENYNKDKDSSKSFYKTSIDWRESENLFTPRENLKESIPMTIEYLAISTKKMKN